MKVDPMQAHRIAIPLVLWGLVTALGCGGSDAPPSLVTSATPTSPPVPAVQADELSELVRTSDKPLLVEFSVVAGCFRCDGMRPQLRQLAEDVQDDVRVVRMDFHANQSLAASLGATVCPSYVLFADGQPAWVQNYPTSGDLLSSRLPRPAKAQAGSPSQSPPLENAGGEPAPF